MIQCNYARPACFWVAACILVFGSIWPAWSQEQEQQDRDPLEGYNRAIYKFNDTLDRFVLKPVAKGYKAVMPEIIDDGVTNFFNNLDDVIVVANDVLQGKFDQAARDSTRLVFNTTFGLLGFFDVAGRYMDLPKQNEDFGQTLGKWGVGEGGYLMLPFLGPSTYRDAPALLVDWFLFNPIRFLNPDLPSRIATLAVEAVDTRADLLRVEKALEDAALDRYVFIREAYLQRRLNLVYDGNPPQSELEDFDLEELEELEELDELEELEELDQNSGTAPPAGQTAQPAP